MELMANTVQHVWNGFSLGSSMYRLSSYKQPLHWTYVAGCLRLPATCSTSWWEEDWGEILDGWDWRDGLKMFYRFLNLAVSGRGMWALISSWFVAIVNVSIWLGLLLVSCHFSFMSCRQFTTTYTHTYQCQLDGYVSMVTPRLSKAF